MTDFPHFAYYYETTTTAKIKGHIFHFFLMLNTPAKLNGTFAQEMNADSGQLKDSLLKRHGGGKEAQPMTKDHI